MVIKIKGRIRFKGQVPPNSPLTAYRLLSSSSKLQNLFAQNLDEPACMNHLYCQVQDILQVIWGKNDLS